MATFASMVLSVGALAVVPEGVDPKAELCIARFASAWAEVKTLRFQLRKLERLRNGRVIKEVLRVKLRKPLRLYVAQSSPATGQEVLYDAAKDPKRLLAHPGRFPDFTVRLDIDGSYATKDQHHPVTHIGFDYTLGVILSSLKIAQSHRNGERFLFVGQERVRGESIEHVRFEGGDAKWRTLSAGDDETVFDLARRAKSDPYLIYYYNSKLDDFTDELDEGHFYRIPPYYAPRLDLWFSSNTHMLVRLVARDYEGRTYEVFEYERVRLNAPLSEADFDAGNPAYDF